MRSAGHCMSIVFEIKLDGEHRQVEVTRDGELFFLDYDINFDIAAQEFGYKMTEAAWLHQRWQADLSTRAGKPHPFRGGDESAAPRPRRGAPPLKTLHNTCNHSRVYQNEGRPHRADERS